MSINSVCYAILIMYYPEVALYDSFTVYQWAYSVENENKFQYQQSIMDFGTHDCLLFKLQTFLSFVSQLI